MMKAMSPGNLFDDGGVPSDGLSLEFTRYGTVQVLHPIGEIDVRNAHRLQGSLVELCGERRAEDGVVIVVDLSRVQLLAAAGANALLAAYEACGQGTELRVVADSRPVLRELQLTGVDERLPVFRTVEQALAESPQRQVEELREQLRQRDRQMQSLPVIERAKGMLIQDFDLDEDEAFAILRRISQDTNVKLRHVAEHVVAELAGTVSEPTAASTAETLNDLQERLRRSGDS